LTRRFHTYLLASACEAHSRGHTKRLLLRQQSARPAEPAHQKQLTGKLIAVREGVVATAKGYEFQYQGWAVAESKCCPFFDFHLDFEEGTGYCAFVDRKEGIKAFIWR